MWFAGTGSFADKNLTLYQDYDATGTAVPSGGNQLVETPADGTVLYSATAFSATSTAPQSATTLFNLTDATTPRELVVGAPGSVGPPPAAPGGGGKARRRWNASRRQKGSQMPQGLGRLGKSLGELKLGMTRSRARNVLTHWSTRGHRYMDFFCLNPIGIRAGYPSSALLRGCSAKERRRVQGRIVRALTASPPLCASRGAPRRKALPSGPPAWDWTALQDRPERLVPDF